MPVCLSSAQKLRPQPTVGKATGGTKGWREEKVRRRGRIKELKETSRPAEQHLLPGRQLL